MPKGIETWSPNQKLSRKEKAGIAAFIASEVAAVVAAAYVVQEVTGSWADAWLLALPFIALLAPVLILLAISFVFGMLPGRKEFPKELELPRWFQDYLVHDRADRMARRGMLKPRDEASDDAEPSAQQGLF